MNIEVRVAGELAVEAKVGEFIVRTDQPVSAGGDGSAPSPFSFFLVSLGTCALYFALRFCRERDIAVEGMKLDLDTDRDPHTHKLVTAKIRLTLPQGFPEKYKKAIIRVMDECTVKRTMLDPPAFEVTAE